MDKGNGPNGGLREGIARCISQACVYSMDAHKTLIQIYGKNTDKLANIYVNRLSHPISHPLSNPMSMHRILNGMVTSSITAGVVFGTYFSIYNPIKTEWYAGTLAAMTTSLIKIPISNGMRIMQTGSAKTLLCAMKKIKKAHSWKGLYTGYSLSLLEDIIEIDMRMRIYNTLPQYLSELNNPIIKGASIGAIAGSVATGITTAFDTIRAQMAYNASKEISKTINPLDITKNIIKERGIVGLFDSMHLRVTSNALKSAIYFSIFELLPNI